MIFSASRRPSTRLGLAFSLALVFSGCVNLPTNTPLIAKQPKPAHSKDGARPPVPKPYVPQGQQSAQQASAAATQAPKSLYIEDDYSSEAPALPALETTDLWERIRDGLILNDHEHETAVRGMVQFFAGQQRHLRESAERAQPYLQHIVENVAARDMPMEFALIPLVESSYDPFAGGGKRASGLWQFMPITAKRFGLNNNEWYEGRRDVLLSTEAALDYLSWLNGRFGDWLLALAAYNSGEGTVDRAIAKAAAQGKPQDFWHLDLPRETERYIPKILALGELVAKSERFDITWPSTPDTPAFVAVELPARTSLAAAADMMDIDIKRLRRLNPALRGSITPPGGPHVLLVPADRAERFQQSLAALADTGRLRWIRHTVAAGESLREISKNYEVSLSELQLTNDLSGEQVVSGQKIWIPRLPKVAGTTSSTPPRQGKRQKYRVTQGDSLWSVARKHNVSVKQLAQWNNLSTTAGLRAGQTLNLYGAKATPKSRYYQVKSGDNLSLIAKRLGVSTDQLRRLNSLGSRAVLQPGQRLLVSNTGPKTMYYRVQPGDSLWSISSRYKVSVSQIKSWNGLGRKGVIRPGQRLKILLDTTG